MLLMMMLGCRGYFDSVSSETILDKIVDRWWYMTEHTEHVDNFYLEPTEAEAGDIWLDFVGGPQSRLSSNVKGGTWTLMMDGQVEVVDEYFDTEGTYDITVKEAVDYGCYDVVVNWGLRINDTICPYEE